MARRLGPGDSRDIPWKNGGGVTRELLKIPHPHDPQRFFLRLSIATVATSGPFSSFPGVDRTLVLLDGEGMALSFGGGPEILLDQALRPLAFPGEAPVEARLLGGPARDFNLMVDRALGGASLRVERLDARREASLEAAEIWLIHALAGQAWVEEEALQAGETLLVEEQRPQRLRGDAAAALVIRAWRHPRALAGGPGYG